jgi:hypothetical protein
MEIELAEELSDRSFFFFFLGVYLGLTALLTNSVHDHGTHNWCFAITGCLHKSPAMRSMTIHHVAVTVMGDRIDVCFSFVKGSV